MDRNSQEKKDNYATWAWLLKELKLAVLKYSSDCPNLWSFKFFARQLNIHRVHVD